MRIVHLSSVHKRSDTRIFYKQCRSLAEAGHAVRLIVADGEGNRDISGIQVTDIGLPSSRYMRAFVSNLLVIGAAFRAPTDIYHLHDPELIPYGIFLRLTGASVYYDAHEDFPKQVANKEYIPTVLRGASVFLADLLERLAARCMSGIVAATPTIERRWRQLGARTCCVANYPILSEWSTEADWDRRSAQVVYVGGISRIRGIREIVEAIGRLKGAVRLKLLGSLDDTSFIEGLEKLDGWKWVDAPGFRNRQQIRSAMDGCVAGLVTLHPTPNYVESLPVKMFEYMASGIPVIASDFPIWKEIISEHGCGICVDPLDPDAIAEAIDYLMQNPKEAERMGRNGLTAARAAYSWKSQFEKLVEFYNGLP